MTESDKESPAAETLPTVEDPHRAHRRSPLNAILAASMLMSGGLLPFGSYSAAARRHDPDRQKTPEDLANMARAQQRREEKARKRTANITKARNGGRE